MEKKLPNRFFVEDKDSYMILLVTKKVYSYGYTWWIQEDFTSEYYDWCYDTSGTIPEEILMERIESGEYTIIPNEEGWIELDNPILDM